MLKFRQLEIIWATRATYASTKAPFENTIKTRHGVIKMLITRIFITNRATGDVIYEV